MFCDKATLVVVLKPNVAVSAVPLGTVAGTQLSAVFQSPVAGAGDQIALPCAVCAPA